MVYCAPMRRAAPTLPVTPAMLRHFVIVTLVATAALAMFAHGENTSAMIEAQKAAQARGHAGAWSNSPRAADPAKAQRSVNGMNVAPGTKLQRGGGAADDYEPDKGIVPGEGNIRNYNPDYDSSDSASNVAGTGPGQAFAPVVPAQIQRDPKGIPLPPGRTLQGGPPTARQAPPRRATAEEVHRMMEASRLRAAGGRGNAGDSQPTED